MTNNYLKKIILSILISSICCQFDLIDYTSPNYEKYRDDNTNCYFTEEKNVDSCKATSTKVTGKLANKCCYNPGYDSCITIFTDSVENNLSLYSFVKSHKGDSEIKYDCGSGEITFKISEYNPISAEEKALKELTDYCIYDLKEEDCYKASTKITTTASCCYLKETGGDKYCYGIRDNTRKNMKQVTDQMEALYKNKENRVDLICKNNEGKEYSAYYDPAKKSMVVEKDEYLTGSIDPENSNAKKSSANNIQKNLIGLLLLITFLF